MGGRRNFHPLPLFFGEENSIFPLPFLHLQAHERTDGLHDWEGGRPSFKLCEGTTTLQFPNFSLPAPCFLIRRLLGKNMAVREIRTSFLGNPSVP